MLSSVLNSFTLRITVLSVAFANFGIGAEPGSPNTAAYRLAVFSADVTPPLNSPLCGGLVKPVASVSEPLQAHGVVILGTDHPIVLCAVDWCEIHNEDHLMWRTVLADAAGTMPEYVAVQSLHQHNAPIADTAAEGFLKETSAPISIQDSAWMKSVLGDVAEAVSASLSDAQPLTHVGLGEAIVKDVASNRRVMGPDGRVQAVRTSATRDPEVRAAPEGTIDPLLKTICLLNESRKLAVLHYYGTHPMSYYGDGVVTSDFTGIAREARSAEDQTLHIYFTGCGGNVTAGKYNDGNPDNRPVLAHRILEAMRNSESALQIRPVQQISWKYSSVLLPVNESVRLEDLQQTIRDPAASASSRISAAMRRSFLLYAEQKQAIIFSRLSIGSDVSIIHLPGEPFIEYQLMAQKLAAGRFVAVAGYGDGGCGYIPLEKSFAEGGYEPTWAFAAPSSENIIRDTIANLLKP
jgi:hypothetical protein